MPRARGIRMRQFIDQDQGRVAGQGGIEVKFVEGGATIRHRTTRQHLEPLQEGCGLGPAVGIDPAYDDIEALGTPLVGCFKHGVRFANTGSGAKEDLEFAAVLLGLFSLHPGEEDVGIGALIVHRCRYLKVRSSGARPERYAARVGSTTSRVPLREA